MLADANNTLSFSSIIMHVHFFLCAHGYRTRRRLLDMRAAAPLSKSRCRRDHTAVTTAGSSTAFANSRSRRPGAAVASKARSRARLRFALAAGSSVVERSSATAAAAHTAPCKAATVSCAGHTSSVGFTHPSTDAPASSTAAASAIGPTADAANPCSAENNVRTMASCARCGTSPGTGHHKLTATAVSKPSTKCHV